MNRPLETIAYAIVGFADDHTVSIEARTLAAAFGDEIASEICLKTVTLASEVAKFNDIRKRTVEALKRDRQVLMSQSDLGFDVSEHINQIGQAIVDTQTGRSVFQSVYPVTCRQLRGYIEQVRKSSASPVVPDTFEVAEDSDESAS